MGERHCSRARGLKGGNTVIQLIRLERMVDCFSLGLNERE